MRDARPISGRMPRSIMGRAMGLQPKYQPPSGHSVINEDSGTPASDLTIPMLFENGSPMLYEDGTPMTFAFGA